jgi:hypothetical protein
MGSVGTGRQLYEQLVADRPRDHRGWLQYAQLERIFGTVDSTQGVQLSNITLVICILPCVHLQRT